MNILPVAVLYVLIGAGVAAAMVLRRGASALDGVLLLLFWPLYGPFVAMADEAPLVPAPARASASAGGSGDLLDALRRAGGTPLASLLPDIEAGRRLAHRLEVAERHVSEIDALFTQAHYNEAAAIEQQAALRASGDVRSAEMIDSRLQIIRRLRVMRDHFSQEIQQIGELLTQLQIQAEIVRIAGTADDDTRELIGELISRVQGLEDMMSGDDTWDRSLKEGGSGAAHDVEGAQLPDVVDLRGDEQRRAPDGDAGEARFEHAG